VRLLTVRRTAVLSLLLLSFSLAIAHAAEGKVLIQTDFSAAGKAVQKSERIGGVLADGWIEHSAWAKAWVEYSQPSQDNATFQRVSVSRIEEGRCQFAYPLARVEDESFFELTLTARSRLHTPVRFGVREAVAPFRFLWEQNRAFGEEWQDQTLTFRLAESTDQIAFYFLLESPGELDLLRMKLVRRSREQYLAHLRESQPEGPPLNLLSVSRFPLGLQSGWSLARDISDGDAIEIAADEKVVGPSSAPALRISDRIASLPGPLSSIESIERQIDSVNPLSGIGIGEEKARLRRGDSTWVLNGAPFAIPRPADLHTASMHLCGEGRVTLHVLADGKSLSWRAIELKSDSKWRRLEVPFKPALAARAHTLRLEGAGRVWMDALRVETGGFAREYAAHGSCEVSLAVDSPVRILFENEPTACEYAVTGYAEGAVLKMRAVNVYGEAKPLPDVTLKAGFLNQGNVDFNIFPERPLGSFRIEAWVESVGGEKLSAPNELVVHRVKTPRYWKQDAPDSPFGVHTLATSRHLKMAKAIGLNWVRLHDAGSDAFAWAQLEYEKGKWAFQDRAIERYRAQNLMILGVLETAPDWASTLERRRHPYFDRYYEPKNFEDFANYCATMAKRYKNSIQHFEVWNEPWLPTYWHARYDPKWRENFGYVGGENSAARYAQLLQQASAAVKSMQPGATIAGFCSTSGSMGERWTRELAELNAQQHCNVVSYHHYTSALTGQPGDTLETGRKQALGALDKAPPRAWITEGSPLAGMLGSGLYRFTVADEVAENLTFTSDRLCRYIVSALVQKTEKIFLYGMHAHGRFGVRDDFRLLVTEDGALHPSATAFANLAWYLEDTQFVERIPLDESASACLFESRTRCVAVIVPPPQGLPAPLKGDAGVTVSDMYGNVVPKGESLRGTLLFAHVNTGGSDGLSKLRALLSAKKE